MMRRESTVSTSGSSTEVEEDGHVSAGASSENESIRDRLVTFVSWHGEDGRDGRGMDSIMFNLQEGA